MLWDEPGYACKTDSRIDRDLFIHILDDELQESLAHYRKSPQDIIFSKIMTLDIPAKRPRNGLKTMGSLFYNGLQSPDFNPIEHVWEHIKRRLEEYEMPPSGMLELWERVEAKWDKIPAKLCQKLIESRLRRIEAALKATGGHAKS